MVPMVPMAKASAALSRNGVVAKHGKGGYREVASARKRVPIGLPFMRICVIFSPLP